MVVIFVIVTVKRYRKLSLSIDAALKLNHKSILRVNWAIVGTGANQV